MPELLHFAGEQVRRLARRDRQLSTPTLEYLAGVDHSREGGPEFVAHVTGEAGIPPAVTGVIALGTLIGAPWSAHPPAARKPSVATIRNMRRREQHAANMHRGFSCGYQLAGCTPAAAAGPPGTSCRVGG